MCLAGLTAFVADRRTSSPLFLRSHLQLVMLALAMRVITLLRLELRAGQALQGYRRQRFIVVLLWLWSPAFLYSPSLWRPTLAPKRVLYTGAALVVVPAIPCHSSVGEAGPQALETG